MKFLNLASVLGTFWNEIVLKYRMIIATSLVLVLLSALCWQTSFLIWVGGVFEWSRVVSSNNIQIVIATLLAYVAWQTYRINRAGLAIEKNKLRLDLFDRRLLVFQACIDLARSIMIHGQPKSDAMQAFISGSANAGFLFGKDIELYVIELRDQGFRLRQLITLLSQPSTETDVRKKYAEEVSEISLWFNNQIECSRQKFKKYLYFSIDKSP